MVSFWPFAALRLQSLRRLRLRQTTAHPEPERVVTEKPALGLAVSTRLMDLAAGGPGPKDDVKSMFNE